MFKDDPARHALVGRAHIVGVRLNRFERIHIKPVLGFRITLSSVNMNGFISLIGKEIKTPP